MLPLMKEKKELYCKQEICHICKKEFKDYNDSKKWYYKLYAIVIRLLNTKVLHTTSAI